MRTDLKAVEMMEAAGFTVIVDEKDKRAGRTNYKDLDDRANIPHEALAFEKDNLRVWKVGESRSDGVYMVWQTARLIEGYYTGHRKFDTLEDVVNEFTPISSQDDLNAYADLLRRNGFTIITTWKPGHSFTFAKDGQFGYIEAGYFYRGLANFSTQHKPSKGNGTGFGFKRDLDRGTALTLDNAVDCIAYAAHSTTARRAGYKTRGREKAEPVQKWESVQEFAESKTILGWRVYPPIKG